jgi:hypothetical protein
MRRLFAAREGNRSSDEAVQAHFGGMAQSF